MNHEHVAEELVELGTASIETKGPTVGKDDHASGFIPALGLSDD